MDTLHELNTKLTVLTRNSDHPGVTAVIRHIEVTERYLNRARSNDEPDLFTDVVYRTNHAFEGILKESYTLLTGEDGSNKTPNQIEQSYANSEVFKPRVMELFTNYRQKWRNPSTHDHQLFFSEQEAFLSILAVTSFISILIDQMTEKLAFDAESAAIKPEAAALTEGLSGLRVVDQLSQLLLRFSEDIDHLLENAERITEVEVQGRLQGFLTSVAPHIEMFVQPALSSNLRPDFIMRFNDETVILELRHARSQRDYNDAAQLIMMYLQSSETGLGMVYHFPRTSGTRMIQDHVTTTTGGRTYNVTTIRPETSDPR